MAFFRSGPLSPLILLATVILVSYQIIGSNGSLYRASVFEFNPFSPKQGNILSRKQALELMMKNVNIYKEHAKTSGQNRNDIIVFPEYGLFGIFGYEKNARRTDIKPFLETIPDPRRSPWNPCNERRPSYPSTEIQRELSCMAKNNEIYVVANVGEKLSCKKRDDSSCPNDGQYQYNTNVVYSSNGTLVAKYRKKHLLKEDYYDSPAKTEVVTFSTHFGKFGLMTSYDSLFKSPLLDLVKKEYTKNIVMPNAWMTSKPLFRAIQWNSALARGQQINLLVSTVHDGHCKSYGSGIYSPDGMQEAFSDRNNNSATLISTRVQHVSERPIDRYRVISGSSPTHTKFYNYSVDVFDDEVTFKFVEFIKQRDNITVCHGRFCCRLIYSSNDRIEKYALGVYKGHVRTMGYLLGVEMCVVVRCFPKCGQPIQRASTYFEKFKLAGISFTTEYIYPQVLTMDETKVALSPYQWEYERGEINLKKRQKHPLHSASLMGRVYKEDVKDYKLLSNANHAHAGQCISVFLTTVAFIASIIFFS